MLLMVEGSVCYFTPCSGFQAQILKRRAGVAYFPFNIYFRNVEALCSLTSGNRTVLCGSRADVHVVTHRHTGFENVHVASFGCLPGRRCLAGPQLTFQGAHAYFGHTSMKPPRVS